MFIRGFHCKTGQSGAVAVEATVLCTAAHSTDPSDTVVMHQGLSATCIVPASGLLLLLPLCMSVVLEQEEWT